MLSSNGLGILSIKKNEEKNEKGKGEIKTQIPLEIPSSFSHA